MIEQHGKANRAVGKTDPLAGDVFGEDPVGAVPGQSHVRQVPGRGLRLQYLNRPVQRFPLRILGGGEDLQFGSPLIPNGVDPYARLAGVPRSVMVSVRLVGVRDGRAIVATVTPSVMVLIDLRWIRQQGTVVHIAADAVAVVIVGGVVRAGVTEVSDAVPVGVLLPRVVDV